MTRHFTTLALGALLLQGAALADSKTITYTILKEGEAIGKETYVLDRDGDHTNVSLTVDSAARVLFIDFRYHHSRTESWNGTQLEKLSADTDDDGTKHHVEVAAKEGGGFTVSSDGKALEVAADAFPVVQWNRAMVGHPVLIAVESDDKPAKVAFKDVGPDSLTIAGQKVAAEHFSLTGDLERELWYDSDGVLVKASFRRRGFGIAIVRDN